MLRRTTFSICALCLCLGSNKTLRAAPPATQPAAYTDSPPITGSAIILSNHTHREDRGSFFSFSRGIRGGNDAGYRQGDIGFGSDSLEVRKHSGDRGSIVDLGERDWSQIDALPALTHESGYSAKAIAGHAYAVHIDDLATEYWAVLRVVKVTPSESVEVEWLRLNATQRAEPAIKPADASRIAALLVKQDDNVDAAMLLQEPNVILQLRTGAGGGNPNRIDMRGETSIYVDEVSEKPLQFNKPPNSNDDAIAYFSGGRIANGKVFVVESVDFTGSAKGDNNGLGEFIVNVGKESIVSERDAKGGIKGSWNGRILLRPGDERTVYAEVANTSSADVKIAGYLTTDADLATEPATQPTTKP